MHSNRKKVVMKWRQTVDKSPQLNNLSKQIELPGVQQVLPPTSHSPVLEKKERTPEEASKAICRMALMAAINSASTKHCYTKTFSTSTPMKTNESSSGSCDTRSADMNCSLPESENKFADESSDLQYQWFSSVVFEETEGQHDHSEQKTEERVS